VPFGAERVETIEADRSPDTPVTVAVGWMVLRTSWGFWILIIGFVMMGIVNGAVITNSISNMTSVTLGDTRIVTGGHSAIWAGYVWSGYLAMVIVAKIALGAIYDRWGLKVGTLLGTAACVLAAIALCFPATVWGPVLAAVTFGFGTCMGTVSPPVMAVKEYGKKDIGTITGVITAFELFGAAVGAVVSGVIFDVCHSFVPVWVVTLVASLVMGLTLMLSIPAARRIVSRQIAAAAPKLDAEGFER
jgi:MFS family permease